MFEVWIGCGVWRGVMMIKFEFFGVEQVKNIGKNRFDGVSVPYGFYLFISGLESIQVSIVIFMVV